MAWFELILASIFILWMLRIALKPRVSPTLDDWKGVIDVLTFVNRKKKYFKEKYFEQEGTRESNQHLRQKSH